MPPAYSLQAAYRAGFRRARRDAASRDILNVTTTALQAVGAAIQHTIIDTTLAVPGQIWTYVVGNKYPINVPSVEACLQAWTTGWLDTVDTAAICRWQGADVPLPGRLRNDAALGEDSLRMQRAWESALNSMQGVLTPDGALELWLREGRQEEPLKERLRRNGIVREDVRDSLKQLAQAVPEAGEIVPAWQVGLITDEQARELLARRGIDFDQFEPFFYADSERMAANEAIEYARRGGFDEEGTRDLLRRSGVFDTFQQTAALTLYQKLPTRADVGQWLQRNVFDQSYVTDFRLDEGFEERYWSRFSTILEAGGWTKDYAYLDYAAHWIVPATSQLAEMVQRLRPGRVDASLVYTAEDYERTLAEQDYAPYYRKRLLATSFRPLPIRFIRAAFQTDALSVQGVSESYQDQGYSREVADFMSAAEQIIKARARASQSRGWTPQALARAFLNGQVDAGTAGVNMAALGFSPAETSQMLARATAEYRGAQAQRAAAASRSATVRGVLAGFRAGTVSAIQAGVALSSLGWPTAAVDAVLQATELAERAALASRATAAVRRAYLRGEMSLGDAQALLVSGGLDQGRVAQLTSLWPLELTPARKHVSAGQLRKGVLSGLLSAEQARAALERLGYPEPDALLLTGEFAYDLAKLQVKSNQATQKSALGAAKDIDRLLVINAKMESRLRAALRSKTPVSKLIAWFASGYIDDSDFNHRMSQMGYPQDATEHYLADAIAKREKLAAKGSSAAPPGQSPGTNGTSGTGGTGGSSVPPTPPGS